MIVNLFDYIPHTFMLKLTSFEIFSSDFFQTLAHCKITNKSHRQYYRFQNKMFVIQTNLATISHLAFVYKEALAHLCSVNVKTNSISNHSKILQLNNPVSLLLHSQNISHHIYQLGIFYVKSKFSELKFSKRLGSL